MTRLASSLADPPMMLVRAAGISTPASSALSIPADAALPVPEVVPFFMVLLVKAESPKEAVSEPLACAVTAAEAVSETSTCPVMAMEAVPELSACFVMTTEAVTNFSVLSVTVPSVRHGWLLLSHGGLKLHLIQSGGLLPRLLHLGGLQCCFGELRPGFQPHLDSLICWLCPGLQVHPGRLILRLLPGFQLHLAPPWSLTPPQSAGPLPPSWSFCSVFSVLLTFVLYC